MRIEKVLFHPLTPEDIRKFCVCQVLEGGGRNLSPLFYDVG